MGGQQRHNNGRFWKCTTVALPWAILRQGRPWVKHVCPGESVVGVLVGLTAADPAETSQDGQHDHHEQGRGASAGCSGLLPAHGRRKKQWQELV